MIGVYHVWGARAPSQGRISGQAVGLGSGQPARAWVDQPPVSESNEDGAKTPATQERQELPQWNRGKTKRKANVKAEADQDAFTRGVMEAGRAAKAQSRLYIGLIVAGLAIVGGVVWYLQRSEGHSVEATRVLSDAVGLQARSRVVDAEVLANFPTPPDPLFETEEARDAARAEALAAARAVDDADVAALAELVAAADAFRSGDHAAALAGYESFIAKQPADHPLIFQAREGRGLALEAQGDLEGALANFEAITADGQDSRFYADVALWHQGRLLERLERVPEAVAVYKRYLETFPEGQRSSISLEKVKARLRELDVPSPATGAAAPAPTPAPAPATPPPGEQEP